MAIEAPSTSEARGILEDFRNRDERFKGRRVQHWVPQVPLEWLETAEPYRVYWTDAVPTEYVDGPLLFVVSVPEVWRQERIVRAQNPEAARVVAHHDTLSSDAPWADAFEFAHHSGESKIVHLLTAKERKQFNING